MTLTEFKIENYRSVRDSGWIKVDDIAAIVGKKTLDPPLPLTPRPTARCCRLLQPADERFRVDDTPI